MTFRICSSLPCGHLKGRADLLFVMCFLILLLSHLVSWDRCGT